MPFSRLLLVIVGIGLSCGLPSSAGDKKKEDRDKLLAEVEARLEKTDPARVKRCKTLVAEVQSFLEKVDSLEILRLHPVYNEISKKGTGKLFHDYEILKQVRVAKAETRKEVAKFLRKAFHWSELRQAACFNPRHGLKASSGKQTLDLVICFECSRIEVYQDKERRGTITTLAKSCPIIDQILRGAEKKAPRKPAG